MEKCCDCGLTADPPFDSGDGKTRCEDCAVTHYHNNLDDKPYQLEGQIRMFCSECLKSVSEIPLYRNNEKGVTPDWRCKKHLDKKPHPDLVELTESLIGE